MSLWSKQDRQTLGSLRDGGVLLSLLVALRDKRPTRKKKIRIDPPDRRTEFRVPIAKQVPDHTAQFEHRPDLTITLVILVAYCGQRKP
jgi:hypothetical protein